MLDDTNITNDSENNKFGHMFLRAMAAFRREGPFSSLPLSSAAGLSARGHAAAAGLSARGHAAASGFGEGRRCAKGVRGLRKIPDRRERGRGCGIHAEGEDGGGTARRGAVRRRGRRLFFEDGKKREPCEKCTVPGFSCGGAGRITPSAARGFRRCLPSPVRGGRCRSSPRPRRSGRDRRWPGESPSPPRRPGRRSSCRVG